MLLKPKTLDPDTAERLTGKKKARAVVKGPDGKSIPERGIEVAEPLTTFWRRMLAKGDVVPAGKASTSKSAASMPDS